MSAEPTTVTIAGLTLPVHSANTVIVGSGAAGLNAALQLHNHGQHDVLVVTERWGAGASNEAGSDKQTYYKLALAHDADDSPRRMAEDLFAGGCMHGDLALCEAQHSAQAFYHLVSLGVPFPHDRYGAYVGYRTDHDRRGRATSAGPLTSHLMCARLGDAVRARGIRILDEHQVIALLTRDDADQHCVCGAIALDRRQLDTPHHGLVLLNAVNTILATGGPGGMYQASVYPASQFGSTGLGLAAGAAAANLTESQFGLASLQFRWNVSGSYQQVIPRYVSTDAAGGDRRDFLNDYFPDMRTLAGAIFRKGYEWPFDAARVRGHGSSLIDLLVHQETVRRGRRVFLDFTANPVGDERLGPFSLDHLGDEARAYLHKSQALQPTPVARLAALNQPALDLYRAHDIDLTQSPLEIAVCAQHCNGGLAGNIWWESNVRHLFPIGEVNGSHGVRRPGGAALNAGQVGGLRAALFITRRYTQQPPPADAFAREASPRIASCLAFIRRLTGSATDTALTPADAIAEVQNRMSAIAAIVREAPAVEQGCRDAWKLWSRLGHDLRIAAPADLPAAMRACDACVTHAVYLEALAEYLARGGRSRGSFLVLDATAEPLDVRLDDDCRFALATPDDFASRHILETRLDAGDSLTKRWVDVRPIPGGPGWFETVWQEYIHDRVVREE
ncbi:MAG: FAD-binding protein [Phycisphaerae bacterium]|jgi:succinate dehydrogenase/fumarate reductase flavoprotein subunit